MVVLAGLLASSFLLLCGSASAAIPFCVGESDSEHCVAPKGIAINQESGDVYVANGAKNPVAVYKADGTFVSSFGANQVAGANRIAVDQEGPDHDVYVTGAGFEVHRFSESGELLGSFGGEGTGPCQLSRPNDPIAVGPGGVVYVADTYPLEPIGEHTRMENRIEKFAPDGTCLGQVSLVQGYAFLNWGLAVSSEGDIYVSIEAGGGPGSIRKYSPTGELLADLGGVETEALTIDATGQVFGKQRGATLLDPQNLYFFARYSATGALTRRFGYQTAGGAGLLVPGIATFSEGPGQESLYASEGTKGINVYPVGSGPVAVPRPCRVKEGGLGSTKATLVAELNPEGEQTHFHFVYGAGSEEASSPSLALGAEDFEIHEAAQTVEGLDPETGYHCRLVAENEEGVGPANQTGTFETKESFEIVSLSVPEVGVRSATLSAEVNPLGSEATGRFEYVEDAKWEVSGFAEAQRAPATDIDFGAGEAPESASVTLADLPPATGYHWRLQAFNALHPLGIVCPHAATPPCPSAEGTFRTFGADEVPDDRRWELVSPAQKDTAEVGTAQISSGGFEVRSPLRSVASGSGESVTYSSFTSFGKAAGSPQASQYISRRTGFGWTTENITPFGFQFGAQLPFKGFSPDLEFAAFKSSGPGADAPGCADSGQAMYLRYDSTGEIVCLSVGGHGQGGCMLLGGISKDGSRAFFATEEILAGATPGPGFTLYEWSAGAGVTPISILPGQGSPAVPTEGTTFGESAGVGNAPNCQSSNTIIRHAVNADGTKAFWTRQPAEAGEDQRLIAYVAGQDSVYLDALPASQKKEKPGSGPAGGGVYWGASADGSIVYFTSTHRLIRGSSAALGSPDLYRYDFEAAEPLSDLTKGLTQADVQGVVGSSEDGSIVYFVAQGVLTGSEQNEAGQPAVEGGENLYVNRDGTTRFIATLSTSDQSDWTDSPLISSARVTPDGRHLAFLSIEAQRLSGFDNHVAVGDHCEYQELNHRPALKGSPLCAEVYLYDAEAGSLACASCNPAGMQPLGPAKVPGWSNQLEGPRIVSDGGDRLFFESFDRLAPADVNGVGDVYEFELADSGSCSTSSASYDPSSGGCHFLVSTGSTDEASFLIDASSDGRDVFFSTRQPLVGWDTNRSYDIYDYREGGGFAEPAAIAPCDGEACKGLSPAPPAPWSDPPTAAPTGETGPCAKAHKKHPRRRHHRKHRHCARKHDGKQREGGRR
jgi:hypothetical protein